MQGYATTFDCCQLIQSMPHTNTKMTTTSQDIFFISLAIIYFEPPWGGEAVVAQQTPESEDLGLYKMSWSMPVSSLRS